MGIVSMLSLSMCNIWSQCVIYGYRKENPVKARMEVLNMIEGLDLVDTWRSENNYSKNLHG